MNLSVTTLDAAVADAALTQAASTALGAAPAAVPTGGDMAAVDAAPDAAGVLIRLCGSRYALAMASVVEVGRIPRLTRVPGVPVWVAGVANWRGRILPVVDLRPLLGGDLFAEDTGAAGRIVIAGDDSVNIGLLVESVDGVTAPPDEVDAVPATVGTDAAGLLAGQWTDEAGPIGLIDVAALMRLRERLPRRGD